MKHNICAIVVGRSPSHGEGREAGVLNYIKDGGGGAKNFLGFVKQACDLFGCGGKKVCGGRY